MLPNFSPERSCLVAFCALFLLAMPSALASGAERPQVTRIQPGGATIGKVTQIEVVGQFNSWPVQIWSSDPTVVWKPLEKPGIFEVTASEQVVEGQHWVRFYNEAGATEAKPFLLLSSPVGWELEPNDRISQVTESLQEGQLMFGVLEKNGDIDHFRIELDADSPISATIDSARTLKSPLDAHLQILDHRGYVLTESMDRYGYDPGIHFIPKRSGTYYLRVFGFPIETDSTISFRGGANWTYALEWHQGDLPWAGPTTAAPLKAAPSPALSALTPVQDGLLSQVTDRDLAADISVPHRSFHFFSQPKQSHFHRLSGLSGKLLRVSVHAQDIGSLVDPVLSIVDKENKQLHHIDDVGGAREPSILWQVPSEGDHWLKIADFHQRESQTEPYFLVVEEISTGVRGAVGQDILEAKVGVPIECNIALRRLAGWTGDVTISSTTLPAEVVLENATFRIENDDLKTHTLRLNFPSEYQGPLGLQLRLDNGSDDPSAKEVSVDGPGAGTVEAPIPHPEPWVSVTPSASP